MTSRKRGGGKAKQPPRGEEVRRPGKKDRKLDTRKQLFNDGRCGPIGLVQLPAEMITRLRGFLYDLDPDAFRPGTIPASARTNPDKFYKKVVRPWLRRHPVLDAAEVRCSGRGLHVLVWFDAPVELTTDSQRQRWDGIVRALQAVLPTDPDAPGITATTRALGSINTRNGVKVKRLKCGKPVRAQAVLDFFDQLRASPFRTVAQILFGTDQVRPCPVCGEEGSTLAALDRAGICYGSCGKVELAQLYDVFLRPRPAGAKK